jgi:hypothetical protein
LAGKKSTAAEGALDRHATKRPVRARIMARGWERWNNFAPRRQGAKACKEEPLSFFCAFIDFAPLREMLFLF